MTTRELAAFLGGVVTGGIAVATIAISGAFPSTPQLLPPATTPPLPSATFADDVPRCPQEDSCDLDAIMDGADYHDGAWWVNGVRVTR
jgi:hypothetical protein